MSDDLIERFIAGHGSYNAISDERQRLYRKVLREFADSLNGTGLLGAGGPELKAFLAAEVDRDLKPTTVRKHMGAIRPFYSWAFSEKLIAGDTLMEIRMVRAPRGSGGRGTPNPYRRADIDRFWRELAASYPWVATKRGENTPERGLYWLERWEAGYSKWARPRHYALRRQIEAIAWLALGGALRMEEIFRLELDDMAPEGEYLVVRSAAKNPDAENRDRAVPWITDEMREAVAAWLDLRERLAPPHDRPWLSLYHTTRTHPMLWRTFEMLMHDIGRGWEFRRMRHTAATEMLRGQIPLETVSRIMGHSRLQQTLEYAQLVKTDLVVAAARSKADITKALAPQHESGDR